MKSDPNLGCDHDLSRARCDGGASRSCASALRWRLAGRLNLSCRVVVRLGPTLIKRDGSFLPFQLTYKTSDEKGTKTSTS